MHKKISFFRLLCASAIGGIYGVFAVYFDIHGILIFFSAAIISYVMSVVSYKFSCFFELLKLTAAVWASASLLGGISGAVSEMNFASVLSEGPALWRALMIISASSVLIFFIIRIIFSKASAESADVNVEINNKKSSFKALVDSGNLLREPISGRAVIVASDKVLENIVEREFLDVISSGDFSSLEKLPPYLYSKVRAIPQKGVSGERILIGINTDKTVIISKGKRRESDAVLALENKKSDDYGGFAATVPSSLLP